MEPSNSKTGASQTSLTPMKIWISQNKESATCLQLCTFPNIVYIWLYDSSEELRIFFSGWLIGCCLDSSEQHLFHKQPNLGLRSNFWLSTLATWEAWSVVPKWKKKFQPPFIIFIGHETLPWISHWSPFQFLMLFALPSDSSALAATFAWWFAAGPWFHRKLSRTFFSLSHLNLKNFSIIYKDLASFSSYILSLDASVRSKLTCLWHVGSLPAWYIQLHLSFKRCLSAWFQQPSPTQLGESTLRYYKDHWCLTRLDSWATHDFTSFHLLCWNAPKASKSYRHCTRSKLQLLPIWVSNHHQLLHSFHELQILLPWPTADGRNMKKLPTTLNSLARTPSNWANETPFLLEIGIVQSILDIFLCIVRIRRLSVLNTVNHADHACLIDNNFEWSHAICKHLWGSDSSRSRINFSWVSVVTVFTGSLGWPKNAQKACLVKLIVRNNKGLGTSGASALSGWKLMLKMTGI